MSFASLLGLVKSIPNLTSSFLTAASAPPSGTSVRNDVSLARREEAWVEELTDGFHTELLRSPQVSASKKTPPVRNTSGTSTTYLTARYHPRRQSLLDQSHSAYTQRRKTRVRASACQTHLSRKSHRKVRGGAEEQFPHHPSRDIHILTLGCGLGPRGPGMIFQALRNCS